MQKDNGLIINESSECKNCFANDTCKEKIAILKKKSKSCMKTHIDNLKDMNIIPIIGMPTFNFSLSCEKMLTELNEIANIPVRSNLIREAIATFVVVRVLSISSPVIAHPITLKTQLENYRKHMALVAETYLIALINVLQKSTDVELASIELVSERLLGENSLVKKIELFI